MEELTLVVLGTYLNVVIFNGMVVSASCAIAALIMMMLNKNR